jgi:hypothetical protein
MPDLYNDIRSLGAARITSHRVVVTHGLRRWCWWRVCAR